MKVDPREASLRKRPTEGSPVEPGATKAFYLSAGPQLEPGDSRAVVGVDAAQVQLRDPQLREFPDRVPEQEIVRGETATILIAPADMIRRVRAVEEEHHCRHDLILVLGRVNPEATAKVLPGRHQIRW